MLDSQHLTYLGCCMLQAAKNLLEDEGLPQHTDERFVMWQPVQECCDQLAVRLVGSRNIGPVDNCNIFRAEYDYELYFSRCVTVLDPETCLVHPTGDCGDVLCTEPEPVDTDVCANPLPSTLHETDFLARERFLFERFLANEWIGCICEGETCGDTACDLGLICTFARWVLTEPEDSGGCAGARMVFTVEYP